MPDLSARVGIALKGAGTGFNSITKAAFDPNGNRYDRFRVPCPVTVVGVLCPQGLSIGARVRHSRKANGHARPLLAH